MHIEMDLVFATLTRPQGDAWRPWLPRDYALDWDHARGAGALIRRGATLSATFDAAVRDFLDPLMPLASHLRAHVGVLRVAVFFDTPICALRLSATDRVARLGLAIDLSIYPERGPMR